MAVLDWLGAAAIALLLTCVQLVIVARHPEPAADEPDAQYKPRYADLVQPPTALALMAATLVCSVLLICWAPIQMRGVGLVWGSAALVLVAVDARTTWLPIRASQFTAAVLTLAIITAALQGPDGGRLVLQAALGATASGGVFALLWWISRSIGFGDVRLAAMTGGLTGMWSIELWSAGLLAGSIAAAGWGVAVGLWRRRHPSPLGKAFAYGPGLWLGPWLGWAWLAVLER